MDENLLLELLLSSGLAQYPDPKLYQAATKLLPEERPTVPVRMSGPKEDYVFKARPNTEAVFSPPGPSPNANSIRINREAPPYKSKNINLLAGLIAHEAEHSRRMKNASSDEGWEESPAYKRQYDVLKRLGEKDNDLLRLLLERSQLEESKEQTRKR